mmetsp:Transcript_43768/g.100004  ORF Transcript_43768/g.100004 Transcript_43768/m.100004 type:complete len:219 (+) Transcript_43768:459-1115(+)
MRSPLRGSTCAASSGRRRSTTRVCDEGTNRWWRPRSTGWPCRGSSNSNSSRAPARSTQRWNTTSTTRGRLRLWGGGQIRRGWPALMAARWRKHMPRRLVLEPPCGGTRRSLCPPTFSRPANMLRLLRGSQFASTRPLRSSNSRLSTKLQCIWSAASPLATSRSTSWWLSWSGSGGWGWRVSSYWELLVMTCKWPISGLSSRRLGGWRRWTPRPPLQLR